MISLSLSFGSLFLTMFGILIGKRIVSLSTAGLYLLSMILGVWELRNWDYVIVLIFSLSGLALAVMANPPPENKKAKLLKELCECSKQSNTPRLPLKT